MLLLTLLTMRRSLTRSRLVRGDPGQRIAGAWREVTDALRLAGKPVRDDLAATEVAGHARQALADVRLGRSGGDVVGGPTSGTARAEASTPTVDELATLLNQVGFAPAPQRPTRRLAPPRWPPPMWPPCALPAPGGAASSGPSTRLPCAAPAAPRDEKEHGSDRHTAVKSVGPRTAHR